MSHQKTLRSRVAGIAILALLIAGPLAAQLVIEQGIDAFTTSTGTQSTVNLPAGFFCPSSAATSTIVKFTGSPLATIPPGALGNADTVVERLKDATVFPGTCDTIPVVVRALELVSTGNVSVACPNGQTDWVVEACTCGWCGVQPITEITICEETGCGCGTFYGDLQIDVCLKFRNVADGTVVGPVQQRIALTVNTPWCDKNPGGVLEFSDALLVDSDCDDQADLAVSCTTNFFPGATTCGGGGGCQCPPPICHEGPADGHLHCVEPPCPCNPHEQPVETVG